MIKSKLLERKVTIGSWISLSHPTIAEIFASAGYDWLVVDLEHSTISIDQAGELIRVIDLCGCSPLVRLTSNNCDQIKRVMDAGAHGIVVPMVCSANDAIQAVAATRYEPAGNRGVGLARAQRFGSESSFKAYYEWQKTEPTVIVQIEHISAVSQLGEIFAVDGVDGFIIGPYDLSCSMGIPGEFENPEFTSIKDEILAAGREAGVSPGIHIVEPDLDQLNKALGEGFEFIAYSVDIRMLDVSARSAIKK